MDSKTLLRDIKSGNFKPVYILHGEEPYFIDELSDAIEKYALDDSERDFNQSILYGKDTDFPNLLNDLKSYPLMAERRLVILKEAQDFKLLEDLDAYAQAPCLTTVFVICHKYKTIDARKKIVKSVEKNGLVFKSDKVKEYQLGDWIQNQVKTLGYGISSKANMLLVESVGNDLSRMVNELNKLSIVLEKGTTITDVHIEENIGISREYNIFELTNAVRDRNIEKALKIVNYFESNPKAANLVVIIPNLFKFFSQLMRIHFLPNKSREAIAQALGLPPFIVGELSKAINNYNPKMIAANIALLHEYDLKSKGLNNVHATPGELMRELIFQLIH